MVITVVTGDYTSSFTCATSSAPKDHEGSRLFIVLVEAKRFPHTTVHLFRKVLKAILILTYLQRILVFNKLEQVIS